MIEIKGRVESQYPLKGQVDYHLQVNPTEIRHIIIGEENARIQFKFWPDDKILIVDLEHAQSIVKQANILIEGQLNHD